MQKYLQINTFTCQHVSWKETNEICFICPMLCGRIFSIKTTKSRKAKQRIIEFPRCVKRAWSPVETQLGEFFDCRMTEKIKLSGLESFLMRIADYLRKNMEESEYKEYTCWMN